MWRLSNFYLSNEVFIQIAVLVHKNRIDGILYTSQGRHTGLYIYTKTSLPPENGRWDLRRTQVQIEFDSFRKPKIWTFQFYCNNPWISKWTWWGIHICAQHRFSLTFHNVFIALNMTKLQFLDSFVLFYLVPYCTYWRLSKKGECMGKRFLFPKDHKVCLKRSMVELRWANVGKKV